jgi:2-polyprenyl-3-methyl-5-hydroxy-6-metoxy-1,4-benzoquinol methylase
MDPIGQNVRCRGFGMIVPTDDWSFPDITDDVVRRYRDNYSIRPEVPVTKLMVQQHMELEYMLKEKLLNSQPGERAEIWVESYDQLYRDLPWLAETSSVATRSIDVQFSQFLGLIPLGSQVIEIGSGVGLLAEYLTEHGRPCVATDITAERGDRDDAKMTWHLTDGIHLDAFEPKSSYDVVLSTQVIEHFHPDDVQRHFEGALDILRHGGSYILTTPHVFLGPADLSRVFSLDRARFMHLKEYTHRELGTIAHRAGFGTIAAVYIPPAAIRKRLPIVLRSRLLYAYLSILERLLKGVNVPNMVLRALLFHGDVFLIATKSQKESD